MTLLNSALAFGALAFVIPLIIHILNRSRFKTVDWGAMHLLESVIKVNHKRFRLDQLILLLVRCLIPALLAFCIARPLLTSSKTMDADTPVSMVILLDVSYSMDTTEQGGYRLKQAIETAKQLVESTCKGSDVNVLLLGSRPIPLFDNPVFDLDAVVRRIEKVEGGFGGGDFRKAVQDGLNSLDEMSNAHRELVIISDFQARDWEPILADSASGLTENLSSMEIEPQLTLIPIGKPQLENVSIDSIDHPEKAIGAGEPHAYRVTVKNHGQRSMDNLRIVLRVNGKEESVSQVTISPESTNQVLFTYTFKEPGSHVVEAEVAADDSLQTDNHLSVSVTAWDKIKVLLVDGDPNPNPLKSETDFLQVALTPYTLGRFQLTDLVTTDTVTKGSLDEKAIEQSKVIVMANVSQLSDQQYALMKAFVDQGGVLFVFPGDQVDLKWYREKMFAHGSGLLPAPFGPRKTSPSRPAKIVAQRFDHPSLEFFNEPENGDLSQAEIKVYYQIEQQTESANGEGTNNSSVMARLDNADPFMVEKQQGKGLVIQIASTCDADWNDLPLKPVFLPLIQQLVTTTASRLIPRRNLIPGEPAVSVYGTESEIKSVPVRTPSGSERVVETTNVNGQVVASFPNTTRPGIYSFATADNIVNFSVNAERTESSAKLLERGEIEKLGDLFEGNVVASAADYLAQDNLRRNGSEIWKYVLMVFLVFLFLEIVLQQKFSRVRV